MSIYQMTPEERAKYLAKKEEDKQNHKGRTKFKDKKHKLKTKQKEFSKTPVKNLDYKSFCHNNRFINKCCVCGRREQDELPIEFNHLDKDRNGNKMERSDEVGVMVCSYHHRAVGKKGEPYYTFNGGLMRKTKYDFNYMHNIAERNFKMFLEYQAELC